MRATGFAEIRRNYASLCGPKSHAHRELVLGPCVVEDEQQIFDCARVVADVGGTVLRGGGVKLRTAHNSFHGLGLAGWRLLRMAADEYGLRAISEVTSRDDVLIASEYLDFLQIGARSLWNFDLLEACAATTKTIVLKRGIGSSTSDWLACATRLRALGARDVVLCERGDKSTDGSSRNAVDFSVLVFLATEVSLPIWLDVSHSAGDPIVALSLLKVAAMLPVNGVMAEVHPNPLSARCDAEQAIPTEWLASIETYRQNEQEHGRTGNIPTAV